MGIKFKFDEEQGQVFLKELNSGKYNIERIPNTSDEYRKNEARDEAVFHDYINSKAFEALDAGIDQK